MHFSSVLCAAAWAAVASAKITYTLARADNPSEDQNDAYAKITAAVDAAIARYDALGSTATIDLYVSYDTGVTTADGNTNGAVRFGGDRAFMTERTALHEISHTFGVGITATFNNRCALGDWPATLPLVKSFDGDGATIGCGGRHFWPYGLNFETEMSDEGADRHVQIVNAMIADGITEK